MHIYSLEKKRWLHNLYIMSAFNCLFCYLLCLILWVYLVLLYFLFFFFIITFFATFFHELIDLLNSNYFSLHLFFEK